MNYWKLAFVTLVCSMGFVYCTKVSTPTIGSETNWLTQCDADSECDTNSCLCNVCTNECKDTKGCSALEDAVCSSSSEAAYAEQCSENKPSSGICLPECKIDDDCASAQGCIDGACVFTKTLSDSSIPNSGNPILADRDFILDSAQGFTAVEDTTIRISFYSDDIREFRFNLWAGCNSIGGSFFLRDGIMKIDFVSVTEMGCDPPEVNSQDTWLGDFMSAEPRLELDGDRLTLTGSNATLSFLDREVMDPDRPLTGLTWIIDSFIDGDAVSNLPLVKEPTLVFDDDGSMQIFSTCNNGEGSYKINGSTITFSGISYQEAGCPDQASQSAEDHIQEVITDGSATYEIEAARLTIRRGSKGIMANTKE